MKYYAVALNKGQIEQLLVTRSDTEKKQEFTGKIYKNKKEAIEDLKTLNTIKNLFCLNSEALTI